MLVAEQKEITCQKMCEYICETFPDIGMTPEEIYNISPTGELSEVFLLYWQAKMARGFRMAIDKEGFITWS